MQKAEKLRTDLVALYDYIAETGEFIRKSKGRYTCPIGSVAGSFDKSTGYLRISVGGIQYYAHRMAWLYHHGEMPKEIDHINGCKVDNRIDNLVNTDRRGNCKNLRLRSTNKSGVTGVTWRKRSKKWFAHITVNYKQIPLGYFDSLDDAAAAREKAKVRYGFTTQHGESG